MRTLMWLLIIVESIMMFGGYRVGYLRGLKFAADQPFAARGIVIKGDGCILTGTGDGPYMIDLKKELK